MLRNYPIFGNLKWKKKARKMADFIFSKILNKKTNGEGMICVGLKIGDVM